MIFRDILTKITGFGIHSVDGGIIFLNNRLAH